MQVQQQIIAVNGIDLSLYCAGPAEGRPVWLLHGFPECWYSWRKQIAPLVEAGYRVFIPEMRGYGQSSAPSEPEAYDILSLCADIQAAMDYFGQQQVAMVGHDWGAVVAWHLALLEPLRIVALSTMSVPYAGRSKRPVLEIMREASGCRFNYILYFQTPGVAEAELEADVERSLKLLMFYQESNLLLQNKPAAGQLFEPQMQVGQMPEWCTEQDFAYYLQAFKRGFAGPLNWYRNFARNWQLTESLGQNSICMPTLFLLGDSDPVGKLEAHTLSKMSSVVAQLEQHVIANCGHWLQSQQAPRVNHLLLDFLQRRYPAAGDD